MSSQLEETTPARPTLTSKVIKFGVGLGRLFYAWVAALYFIAWMELGWSGGIREMYQHVRSDPHLAAAAAIAVLFGWFAGAPTSKSSNEWLYRHPLITQGIVAAALALGVAAMWLF